MCAWVNKNPGLSSSLEMETMITKKQGIVSILGSDSDKSSNRTAAASLQRTLSADMSSKKWLSENGFVSSMKKIASSKEFYISEANSSSSSSEEEIEEEGEIGESRTGFHIWGLIQEEKNKNKEQENHGQFDMWNSILSQNVREGTIDNPVVPPPYVHPLVKRSASALSEKSLEICTESLGSETGSDVFSSHPSSETGDVEEDKDCNNVQDKQESQEQEEREEEKELIRVFKHNYLGSKKRSLWSFPPLIPSLSLQDGASTYMKTRRDNGRLVLEAVSVPSKKIFFAQRQDGRLVLSFANRDEIGQEEEKDQKSIEKKEDEKELEELEKEFEGSEEEMEENEDDEGETKEKEEEEEDDKGGVVMEQAPELPNGLTSVHRLALTVNKPIGLVNRKPTWTKKCNHMVKPKGGEEVVVVVEKAKPPTLFAQSLPPRPPVARPASKTMAAAASFNAYEYYWRPKPTLKVSLQNISAKTNISTTSKALLTKNVERDEQQAKLAVLRRNKPEVGDESKPLMLKNCKDQKDTLLFWEPYCIATS